MAKAGEVHSIRLPTGTAKKLRERGYTVSQVARQQVLAFVAVLERQEGVEQQ